MKKLAMETISMNECCRIVGGADKNAQNALYYIGYVIGFLVRCVASIFVAKEVQAAVVNANNK